LSALCSSVLADQWPRIVLALSCGDASGFSHIGALKVLETLREPVVGIAGRCPSGISIRVFGGVVAPRGRNQRFCGHSNRYDWM